MATAMIKDLTKAVVAGFVGKPIILEKRDGSLCRVELGGDNRIGIINYAVTGQFLQSGLDRYNTDMTFHDADKKKFDIVAAYIANDDVDAGDLVTALLGGKKLDGTRVAGGKADILKKTTLIWKRVDKTVVTRAQLATLLGVSVANMVIVD